MQYLYIFIIYLTIVNLFTSYRLIKDEYYNPIQKSIQLLIVWLVPFLGAMIVSHFNTEEKRELKGIYKKISWLSRVGAALLFIKLYSKREILIIENNHADYCDGWYETNLVETGFGESGGGDA